MSQKYSETCHLSEDIALTFEFELKPVTKFAIYFIFLSYRQIDIDASTLLIVCKNFQTKFLQKTLNGK